MKIITIRRKTKTEHRYHRKMGKLITQVTKIQKILFGVLPIKTIHEYRETYHGKVKDCEDCKISKV